ncbi:hypothetical protein [Stutzerimonas stutzeri]|uniref:hypothetical protein n=1 Tax=Stutzerimonas stutzeri TaxID=316 RepID=UPI002658EF2D|nr:hypothetical protein [Stutzerimonas stutzeri]MCF6780606.1 hypothetical protein [Stutzerimonas stutzeri]
MKTGVYATPKHREKPEPARNRHVIEPTKPYNAEVLADYTVSQSAPLAQEIKRFEEYLPYRADFRLATAIALPS